MGYREGEKVAKPADDKPANLAASDEAEFTPRPWRIDILTDFGGNRAGQSRRARVAECARREITHAFCPPPAPMNRCKLILKKKWPDGNRATLKTWA
jgi:hypothetical protein